MSKQGVEPLIRHGHKWLTENGINASPSKVSKLARSYLQHRPPVDFLHYLAANVTGISEHRRRELILLANVMQTHAAPSTNRGTKSYRHINAARPL